MWESFGLPVGLCNKVLVHLVFSSLLNEIIFLQILMTLQYIVHFLISHKPCNGYLDPPELPSVTHGAINDSCWLSHHPLLEIRGNKTWGNNMEVLSALNSAKLRSG